MDIVSRVMQYERDDMPVSAETEVKKLVSTLRSASCVGRVCFINLAFNPGDAAF
jgi:hypothetical protein